MKERNAQPNNFSLASQDCEGTNSSDESEKILEENLPGNQNATDAESMRNRKLHDAIELGNERYGEMLERLSH